MKNRAKCAKCNVIIESFHSTDFVACKCGRIAVDGGPDIMKCFAVDWDDFRRIDDNGNEIIPKIIEKNPSDLDDDQLPGDMETGSKPSKEDLLKLLNESIRNIEKLPTAAMTTPINHYDFVSILILLSAIFRSDCKEDS